MMGNWLSGWASLSLDPSVQCSVFSCGFVFGFDFELEINTAVRRFEEATTSPFYDFSSMSCIC